MESKSPSIGPMRVQPVEHSSTAHQMPAKVSTIGEEKKKSLPKSQQARMVAVRAAKENYAAQFSTEAATSAKER
jgi:hypothetical protein